ncbi:MAG: hypothetical protein HC876_22025 [Chloroflexaceae bacterium]|nr:hypothetical protein [Chloroflexaceae bacterium]
MVAFSQTMNPASIGLSFAVLDTVTQLDVEVTYGLYEDQDAQDEKGKTVKRWQRRPFSETVTIPVNTGTYTQELDGGGRLEWVIRSGTGTRNITLFLVNRNTTSDQSRADDTLCLFQPRLVVRGTSETYPFVHREPGGMLPYDPDLESHRLLYRDCYEFAVGHGCSVDWNDIQHDRAGMLETTFIPAYELPATTPIRIIGLEMQVLADAANPAVVRAALTPLLGCLRLPGSISSVATCRHWRRVRYRT